jgi:hypothetical protein
VEGFERSRDGIDEPEVRNALARVDRHFFCTVDRRGRRRENLADTIGSQLERGCIGKFGHARSAPTSEIGNEDVAAEVKFRFVEEDPATRTALATMKRAGELATENRGSERVA